MAMAAIVFDRVVNSAGLHGNSFMSMLLGFESEARGIKRPRQENPQ